MAEIGPLQSSRGATTYTVKPGDTLAAIGARFGVDWRALAAANNLANPNLLRVGMILKIPAGAGAGGAASSAPAAPTLPAAPSGPPARPAAGPRLGDLSMYYETGFRPGQEAQAAAVVSNGLGDPGGVSYGAYQLASTAAGGRQVQTFLRYDGSAWAGEFGSADPTVPAGPFSATWKAVAAAQPQPFFAAQHSYIERSHYTPVVNYVAASTGLHINARSRAVQNVVWSMAVQHGAAPRLVADAVNAVGPVGSGPSIDYDRALINKLYDVREAYVVAIGRPDLLARYAQERPAALRELGS